MSARNHYCPTCHAPPGEICAGQHGTHAARKRVADALAPDRRELRAAILYTVAGAVALLAFFIGVTQ